MRLAKRITLTSINGIANKANLKDWADYAKGNSYIGDKAQAKEQLSGKGADQDIKQGMPPLPRQKDSEGKDMRPSTR